LASIDIAGYSADTYFKRKYGKYLSRIPTFGILRDKIGFDTSKKIGEDFREQIELELEQGVTEETGLADGFSIEAPLAGGSKPATIQSSILVLRTGLGIRGLMAAQGGDREVAFRELTKNRVRSMWKSINKRLELAMLYGQCSDTGNVGSGGLGVVESTTATSITFTKASWSAAIWSGMKDALIEAWAPADPPVTRRVNTGTAPTGYTGEDAGNKITQITGVVASTRTININALPTGTVANDIVFLYKQRGTLASPAWKQMIGIHRFSSQVTGTLLGIDTAVYDQWQPNPKNAGAVVLSFDLVNDLIADAIGKGLEGNVICLTNPFQWGKMMTDLGALRRIDYSQNTNKYVVGASEIEFHSANGKISIIPHPYVKMGFSYVLTIDNGDSYAKSDSDEGDENMSPFSRGGITDVTFNRPAGLVKQAEVTPKFFYETNNEYTVELRCVSDQFLMCNAVGHQTMIYNLATA